MYVIMPLLPCVLELWTFTWFSQCPRYRMWGVIVCKCTHCSKPLDQLPEITQPLLVGGVVHKPPTQVLSSCVPFLSVGYQLCMFGKKTPHRVQAGRCHAKEKKSRLWNHRIKDWPLFSVEKLSSWWMFYCYTRRGGGLHDIPCIGHHKMLSAPNKIIRRQKYSAPHFQLALCSLVMYRKRVHSRVHCWGGGCPSFTVANYNS